MFDLDRDGWLRTGPSFQVTDGCAEKGSPGARIGDAVDCGHLDKSFRKQSKRALQLCHSLVDIHFRGRILGLLSRSAFVMAIRSLLPQCCSDSRARELADLPYLLV